MTQIEVYTRLKELALPTFRTSDAARFLGISTVSVAKLLSRLAKQNSIVKIKHALWAFPEKVDRLALPTYLSAPFPAYVSLQSALYFHGLIDQIPSVVYAVTIGRTKRFETPLGDVSLHRIDPRFFFAYTTNVENDVRIATMEKALIDYLYFRPSTTRLFGPLPELELPKSFNTSKAKQIMKGIPSRRTRTLVHREFFRITKIKPA